MVQQGEVEKQHLKAMLAKLLPSFNKEDGLTLETSGKSFFPKNKVLCNHFPGEPGLNSVLALF